MTTFPPPGPNDPRWVKGGCRHKHWHGYRGDEQLTDCFSAESEIVALRYGYTWIIQGGLDMNW